MHQLVLITALSATTGLFGGGKHCGKSHHGKKAVVASCYSASPCGTTYASHQGTPVPSSQGYPTTPAKMVPATPTVPAAPTAPPAPPLPTPSSAELSPSGLAPAVATGDLR